MFDIRDSISFVKILKSYFSYSSLFESLGLIRNLRKDILLIWIFIVILWSWDCRHKWNNQLEQECQIHIPRRAHPTAHERMPGSMCLQGGRILSTHAQEHAHLLGVCIPRAHTQEHECIQNVQAQECMRIPGAWHGQLGARHVHPRYAGLGPQCAGPQCTCPGECN